MACFYPVPAWELESGELKFDYHSGLRVRRALSVPCQRCVGCLFGRVAEWGLRADHERKLHKEACWVTLTFDDEHFPCSDEEWRREVVLFGKRMRKAAQPQRLRTFGCCELGDRTFRPHAHLCVYGFDFPREVPRCKGHSGELSYSCELLSKLWPNGFAVVGDLSHASASYTAGYCVKKVTGRDRSKDDRVPVVHPVTGEVFRLSRAFPVLVSRRPGLGAGWFGRYGEQAVEQGAVLAPGGERLPVPKYYRKLAKRVDPLMGSQAKAEAELRAYEQRADNTPERLAVKEEVFRAKVRNLRREGV